MVGQRAGGAAIVNLARITSDLVGIPYKLGGTIDELDCFSLIAQYLKVRGIEIDSSFQGHKLSDYPDDYKANPKKMMRVAVDYFASLITEIPSKKVIAGDILFVTIDDSDSLVIAGGNGIIIAATEHDGVTVLKQNDYTIKRVFRCPQKQ